MNRAVNPMEFNKTVGAAPETLSTVSTAKYSAVFSGAFTAATQRGMHVSIQQDEGIYVITGS